ncbi:MAG: DUF5658 family protein [Armatimonadota bacterium]|nr:DUF5658 family protein [Armatimonadota bacterium]
MIELRDSRAAEIVPDQGLTVAIPERLSRGILIAGLYALLSVADMGFSSAAFVLGIPEANPVIAWLIAHGLFVPAKLAFTAVAAALIAWLYHRGQVRPVAWAALVTMAAVDIYHVWGLSTL